MIGLVAPVILAVALALALGGSLAGWALCRVRWWPVAIGALLVQLALFNPPVDRHPLGIEWGPWIWLITMASLLAVLLRNGLAGGGRLSPWLMAALGVALNVFVIAANGGYMPQSVEARAAARGVEQIATGQSHPQLRNVVPIGPTTRFVWLGDVIPQPSWLPRANVISVGDLLLSAGLACWAFQVTLPRVRRSRDRVSATEGR